MKRTYINKLEADTESKIAGFVTKVRDTKYMVFIMLKDTTGELQVSIDKKEKEDLANEASKLTVGSVITLTGKMVLSEYVKNGGKEYLPETLKIESLAEPSPLGDDAEIDSRLDYRWIDLRNEKNTLIFKVQSVLAHAMKNYLYENNFIEIHTPKIIGAASESGSEVFELKYFDRKAFLAQSPQFYKQMAMAAGFDRIFEVAPAFRAENSNTNRHATEFTSFDLEFSYIESVDDVMSLEEELLIAGLTEVKKVYGDKIKEVFGKEVIIPTKPFPRIRLEDLYKELNTRYNFTIPTEDIGDLNAEAEKLTYQFAMEKYNSEFMFIVDYAATKRPFYHMRDENGVLQGYDLIWRGTEITSGSQREHRYDELVKNAKEKGLGEDVKFYLQFFKYGCPPHGGFAIGLDRLTMLLLGVPIKEAQFVFRGPNRIEP